jgi:hypothetical protein
MCGHKFWKEPNAPRAAETPKAEPTPPAPVPAPAPVPRPFAPSPSAAEVEAGARASSEALDRLTQPVLVVSFLLVLGGLTLTDKASGGALLLLGLVPALFVLALSGLKPTLKRPETPGEWMVWLATKLAGVIAVMVLAAVAIIAALFMACWVILAALGLAK